MDQHLDKWAVVNLGETPMKFSFLHESWQDAAKEASRLTTLSGARFAVVRIVAVCQRTQPVEWRTVADAEGMPF